MLVFKVCIWSDGTWCDYDDLEDYLKFMSDDYFIFELTINETV